MKEEILDFIHYGLKTVDLANLNREHLVNCFEELEKENAELKEKYEKLLSFATERTECCDVCPQSDICINEEGTCPYAGILKGKGNEEKVTREWIEQFLNSEVEK